MDRRSMEDIDNQCCICQDAVKGASYLNHCVHKFCYDCITRWYEEKNNSQPQPLTSVKCPLCNGVSTSLVHNYDGEFFDVHYFDPTVEDSFHLTQDHRYRLKAYSSDSGLLAADRFDIRSFWKNRKYLQPNRFLKAWLKRELQALMRVEDTDIVVQLILGTIQGFCKSIQQAAATTDMHFKEEIGRAVSKFVPHPKRFAEEVVLFMASGMNLDAYDGAYRKNTSSDLRSWVDEKLSQLILQQGGDLATSCINLAAHSMSNNELKNLLIQNLNFPPTGNTSVFSKILFDRISGQKDNNLESRGLKRSWSQRSHERCYRSASQRGSRTVYVRNLSRGVCDMALKRFFHEKGLRVVDARVNRDTGRIGVVTLSSSQEVQKAVKSLNGADLDGRQIRVSKTNKDPSNAQQGSRTVYVGNLSRGVDGMGLKSFFNEKGLNVVDARVNRDTGRIGVVTLSSSQEVQTAIKSLNGADLEGRQIRVSEAEV